MKNFTVEQILKLNPCPEYTSEHVRDIFGDKESMTLEELLRLKTVPVADRVWFAFRPTVLTQKQRQDALTLIVTRAITNHALNCGVPTVEEWARKWLSGEDRTAEAAWAAAAEAAEAAEAAWAAWAARAAARAAAAAAEAWAAEAAWAAARAAAEARAEVQKQVDDILNVLAKAEGK